MNASFDDLVTAATLGLSRKPFAVTELDGPAAAVAGVLDTSDPATALLDAAALMTVARRAGFRPEPGVAGSPASPASPEEAAPFTRGTALVQRGVEQVSSPGP